MTWADRAVAVLLMALVAYFWPMTNRFPGSAADFPRVVLIAIGVLAVLLLVRSLFPSLELLSDGEGKKSISAMALPLAALAVTAVSVYLMRYVTFFPAVALLGVTFFFVLRVRNRVAFALSYAGMMLFVFLVFQTLLNVPLTSTRLFGG